MTVPKLILDFLRENEGSAFCADCIKAHLKLLRRQQAQQATAALALNELVNCQMDFCDECFSESKEVARVISSRRRTRTPS